MGAPHLLQHLAFSANSVRKSDTQFLAGVMPSHLVRG
jgi:hypothetical protein